MGSIAFLLPKSLPAAAEPFLKLACFAGGYDLTPSPTTVRIQNGQLLVTRATNESGFLFLPWLIEPSGPLITMTATLRERVEPYSLLVELARGKLNQVRTQTAEWAEIGLRFPPDYNRDLDAATHLFGTAVLTQPSEESDAAASSVLQRSFQIADHLVHLYIEQMIVTRQHEEGKIGTWFAASCGRPPLGELSDTYSQAFNSLRIGVRWRDVEAIESQYNWEAIDGAIAAAKAMGKPITFGPVIDLAPGMLPDWASGWEGDLPTLAAFMCDYLETLIGRYRGVIRRWVICSGLNHSDGLRLSDDERLRLASRLCESALQLDPDLDLVLGIAQPWGDYLCSEEQTISPLAFADDLIRTGLRIKAIELEIRSGTRPRGSYPRDLLDTSRSLDLFSLLGIPIDVLLSHPSSSEDDPHAEHQEKLWPPESPVGPNLLSQTNWGAPFAALALAKPQVRSVTWDHWSDADPHFIPSGGLIQSDGSPTPLLTRLAGFRTIFLGDAHQAPKPH